MSNKRRKTLNYFFYKGDLCKKIHINRGSDIITAWNYPKGEVQKFQYSDVKRNGERAFSTAEVQKLIRRGRRPIERALHEGMIPMPQQTYGLETRSPFKYLWTERDIMNLHDYLKTVHIGRPRHDGGINTRDLPSRAELRAMIRQDKILYVETEDGKFVPTWQAEKF